MPASVAVIAEPMDRLPDLHRNTTARCPGAIPALPRSSMKLSLWEPSVLVHST